MSILAWTRPGVVNWGLTSSLPPGGPLRDAEPAHDRDRGRLGHLVGHLGLGLLPLRAPQRAPRRRCSGTATSACSCPPCGSPSSAPPSPASRMDTDPAKMVSAVFGGVTSILVLLLVLHGPIATNILNVYSAALAALSMGRAGLAHRDGADRGRRRLPGHDLLRLPALVRQGVRQLDDQPAALDEPLGRRGPRRLLHRAARGGSTSTSSTRSPTRSAYGDVNWGGDRGVRRRPRRGLVWSRTASCPRCRAPSRPSCSPART